MWRKPHPSWKIIFSTSWYLDEESPAFDFVRLYAIGMHELKMFPTAVHARNALVDIEKSLWRTQPLRCAIGVLVTLIFGALIARLVSGSTPLVLQIMAGLAW